MVEAVNLLDVDAIEQHRQLGRVELDVALATTGVPEAAPLQPLVPEHEAALVEGQDLGAVPSA